MLARRIATAGVCLNRRGYITYNPSKKPFEYHTEKDGKQVPLDLEGPSAPHWNDNNEEFWKKADDFCADQPEVPIPYKLMAKVGAYLVGSIAFFKLFLEPGSAGRAWCDPYVNNDERLMFGMPRDSFMTAEDRALVETYRDIARTLPLLTRVCEVWKGNPLDNERMIFDKYRRHNRFLMGHTEDFMRMKTPQQRNEGLHDDFMTLMGRLEQQRLSLKPEEVDVHYRIA